MKRYCYIAALTIITTLLTTSAAAQCPCTVWNPNAAPGTVDSGDATPIEAGVKVRSDVDGFITAVRFYKAATNTGPHTGHVWSNTGTLLATANFVGETASGWQQANLSSPVPVTAGTTYVVSYFAPVGHYSFDLNYFGSTGVDNPPVHALADGVDGPNAVYNYGSSAFPTSTYNASSYWVDVVFDTSNAPNVSTFSPSGNGVTVSSPVSATFTSALDATTVNSSTFELFDSSNTPISGTISYNGATQTATLQPGVKLAASTTYTAVVVGGPTGVKDTIGNPMKADFTWTFTTAVPAPPPPTCPCSIWPLNVVPGTVDSGDPSAGEYGVKFTADVSGSVTGIRFYKGSANIGTHVGNLWSSTGQLLQSATFTNESNSGWQQVNFSAPVFVSAGTTYIASYYAPFGHYSFDKSFLQNGYDTPPLHAVSNAVSSNGIYSFGASSTFPTSSFSGSSYWVDVVFVAANSNPQPAVSSTSPANGSTGASIGASLNITFNEPMNGTSFSTSTVFLEDSVGNPIPGTVSYNSATATVVLKPSTGLVPFTSYTATVKGSVTDSFGNTLGSDYVWSFTTGGPPTGSGPGGPILVISSASNPFTGYYDEILRAEGLNEFSVQDISAISASTLSFYNVAILGDMQLTSSQVSMLSSWVANGGNLIAMHPDKQLAGMLGLSATSGTLSESYLKVQTTSVPGNGIVGQPIQYHGTADLYALNGATSVATLYSNAATATPYPAVTWTTFGAGQVATFTYDLARSVIYTHQGNPAWSGQERLAIPPMRAEDLFFGNASFDPQRDWVDLTNVQIPQADEQQRLLVNLIEYMNSRIMPLPRFWYLPSGFKAAVVMTGDDHNNGGTIGRFNSYLAASAPNCSLADWQCVRGTSYMWDATPITDAQAAAFVAQGFELALHVDTSPTCTNWTAAELTSAYSVELDTFSRAWPSVPAPVTHRMHCISESDYDTQPQVERLFGIRFDTNYYYWPSSWMQDLPGLFTGSGMPMRFADRNGNTIDVYQAATQIPDEDTWTYPDVIDTLLDNAIGPLGYYAVITTNMHTDFNPSPGSDAIVSSAQARGVPIVTSLQMLTWVDGRNTSSFSSLAWSGGTLSFAINVGAGARNLEAMLPANSQAGGLTSITNNGGQVPFTFQTIKGVTYAVFSAAAGSYQAAYGGATVGSLAMSGTITGPGAVGATVTLGGTESQTVTTDSQGKFSFGGISNGPYTVTPTKTGFVFTPPSITLNVTGSSVTGVNFSSAVQTFTISGSITGAGVNGATVTRTGGSSTKTDSLGNYQFTGLTGGSYTITPSQNGFVFSPLNAVVNVNGANVTGVNFTGVAPAALSSLTMNPTSVTGGTSSTGTVTLSAPAPAGGLTVSLSDNSSSTSTPASVTVAAGATTATFTVSTSAVGSQTTVTISGTFNGVTKSATLTLNPPALKSFTLNPTTVVGGASSTATVTLTGPAPSGGAFITLSDNSAATQTPASVTVQSGATTATVSIGSTAVSASTVSTVSATYSGATLQATVTVNPPALNTFTLNPTTVVGGNSFTGTVTLTGPAPTGGVIVTLSDNSSSAQTPATVTVAAGATSATFTVPTTAVSTTTTVTESATYNGKTVPANVSIIPLVINSVAMNPSSVAGGVSSTGTVTLNGPAPSGGVVVTLSDNSSAAQTPGSVTVLAGSTTATFTVTTSVVTTTTTSTESATFSGKTVQATLTINPAALSAVTVNPTSVTGGSSSIGTVTLTGPAPSGGIVVSLSDNSSAAQEPSSVTVPAGSTTATFTVTTSRVSFSTNVTLTARSGFVSKTAVLTVR
jgi:hypothetical protein